MYMKIYRVWCFIKYFLIGADRPFKGRTPNTKCSGCRWFSNEYFKNRKAKVNDSPDGQCFVEIHDDCMDTHETIDIPFHIANGQRTVQIEKITEKIVKYSLIEEAIYNRNNGSWKYILKPSKYVFLGDGFCSINEDMCPLNLNLNCPYSEPPQVLKKGKKK